MTVIPSTTATVNNKEEEGGNHQWIQQNTGPESIVVIRSGGVNMGWGGVTVTALVMQITTSMEMFLPLGRCRGMQITHDVNI